MAMALCFACAESGHDFKTCKYRQFKCKKCKTSGHIAAACETRTERTSNSVNNLDMETERGSDDDDVSLYNIVDDRMGRNRFTMELV